ncbi:MAG TPA: D-alanine--D-alanine ligase [Anaerohalosphaeraceae bacterium]|nr:D-alanine--D-alanine ligase [Anaerohalosphaeraceae bacterium]
MRYCKKPFKTVAVLAGGIGEERPVSLQSGQNVYQALKKTDLDVRFADIHPDDLSILDDPDIDIFFLILHGQFGEDGHLQKILEEKNLVYTGSDSASSCLAFDKWAAKKRFREWGIPTAPAVYVEPDTEEHALLEAIAGLGGEQFVVKPLRQGSSVGVQIARTPQEALRAARECSGLFGDCMVERFIRGREITVGIVDRMVLPVIEIRPKQSFYDYQAKYIDDRTEFLFDTFSDVHQVEFFQKTAMDSFRALGCRHFGRVDMIIDSEGTPWVLEINTLPGFTSHSLLPMAAARAGLDPTQLCLKILETAWLDFHKKG